MLACNNKYFVILPGQTNALLKILAALQDFQEGIARLGGDLNLSLYPLYDITTGKLNILYTSLHQIYLNIAYV